MLVVSNIKDINNFGIQAYDRIRYSYMPNTIKDIVKRNGCTYEYTVQNAKDYWKTSKILLVRRSDINARL